MIARDLQSRTKQNPWDLKSQTSPRAGLQIPPDQNFRLWTLDLFRLELRVDHAFVLGLGLGFGLLVGVSLARRAGLLRRGLLV